MKQFFKKYYALLLIVLLQTAITSNAQKEVKLVILHTNDTHSQVEPHQTKDLGGYARRLGVIDSIRKVEKNVLLLDAGDFCQGTPYFNFFNGKIEIEAMNRMKYDAGTLGNHEFDNGMDSLLNVLKMAEFPIISANYDVSKTPLKPYVKEYIIKEYDGLKVGIFGIGVNPEGLIFKKNYKGMRFIDPIKKSEEVARFLKEKKKCDFVIGVSHTGNKAGDDVTDYDIGKQSENIDLIVGGHSHEVILNKSVMNKNGEPVIVVQVGKSGFYLGKVELFFNENK